MPRMEGRERERETEREERERGERETESERAWHKYYPTNFLPPHTRYPLAVPDPHSVVAEQCDVALIASVEKDGVPCLPVLCIDQVTLLEDWFVTRREVVHLRRQDMYTCRSDWSIETGL